MVLVLDEEQHAFGDELEGAAVDGDDPRRLGLADDGAGDGDDLAAREHGLDEDELLVVGFGGRADGLDLDAEGLELAGGVDVGDAFHDAAEVAALDGAGDGVGALVGAGAEGGQAERLDAAGRGQLARDGAELLGEGEEGLDRGERLRVDGREVDRVGGRAAAEHGDGGLGDFDADVLLGFGRGGAEVRGEVGAGEGAQGVVLGEGLFDEHVEAAAAALAGSERGREGGFVDDAAAGAVHDLHALLHLREGGFIDHAFGRALLALLDEGHVDGDVVGQGEDFVEGRDRHAEGLGTGLGEVRIVGQHLHAEGEGALGDLGADAAETEHAEGLAEEFGAGEGLTVPLAFVHGLDGFRHRAGEGEQVGEGKLGGRDGIARGGVHHDDAALGGGIDVDVVDPHPGAADADEALGGGEDFAGDLGL